MRLYKILRKLISQKCRKDKYDVQFHDSTEHTPVFTLLALRTIDTGVVEYSFYRDEILIAKSGYVCPLPVESISIDIGREKYQVEIDRFATIPTIVNVMDLNRRCVIRVLLNGVGEKECRIGGHTIRENNDFFTMDNRPLCFIHRKNTENVSENGLSIDTEYRLEFFSDKYIGLTMLLFMI